MVYAKHLRDAGTEFMKSSLGYDPGPGDGRVWPSGGGGAFMAVHLRREDYKHARPSEGGKGGGERSYGKGGLGSFQDFNL